MTNPADAPTTHSKGAAEGAADLSPDRLKALHEALLLPRLIEEKMLLLLRQGRLSKWFSGIGQEAIAVGVTAALHEEDWILPMHRNLGVFTGRGLDLVRLFRQLFGKADGFTNGRDRTFHFGFPEKRIVGMISHLGANLPVADGLALGAQLKREPRVAVAFTGEGSTSEGDFHEAVNLAAVWKLPVLFVVENNGYGLSTPTAEQYACRFLADRAVGYGIAGRTVDGNDLLAVYRAACEAADRGRRGEGPTLLEFMTFRMRGHEEASGTAYVPPHLFEEWSRKDPVARFESLLLDRGILAREERDVVRARIKAMVDELVEVALAAPDPSSTAERELADVYAPAASRRPEAASEQDPDGSEAAGALDARTGDIEGGSAGQTGDAGRGSGAAREAGGGSGARSRDAAANAGTSSDVRDPGDAKLTGGHGEGAGPEKEERPSGPELRYVDAIKDGLRLVMRSDPTVVLLGQDIAEYGGVFKVTEGFVQEFGKERVRNTPIIESGALGAAFGLALEGFVPMVEMQFGDFITCGFNQIVNNIAKARYRWGARASMVIRCPIGGGVGAGPFHSQNVEAWFTHVAGLKVVAPATPYDAKGLLMAAFADGNPVLYLEHKYLYRSARGPVPEGSYSVPIGAAATVRAGEDLTVVTYGVGVSWALEAAETLAGEGRRIEVIDLRSLLPWDLAAVLGSARKTGRVLVLHEAPVTGGFGAELAAVIGQEAFEWLDAPVARLGGLDTPVPFSRELERIFSPKERVLPALRELLAY